MTAEQAKSPSRFQPLRDFLEKHDRFLLLTHIGPDGDGLLACLALSRYLHEIGKQATVVTEDKVPAFAAPFDPEGLVRGRRDLLAHDDWAARFDACLILDTGKASRLGRLEEPLETSGLPLAVVDHHIREDDNIDCPSVIDAGAAAVGELMADFMEEEGYAFHNPLINRALMAAIVYDTGQFRFTNTTKRTLNWAARLVELGASPGEAYSIFWESNGAGSVKLLGELMSRMTIDCGGRLAWFTLSSREMERFGVSRDETEEYISVPRSIESVEVIAFLSELENGRIRVSMRSKGRVEIHDVARTFGGGGHAFAAGARMRAPLDEAARLVTAALAGKIRDVLGPDQGA